MMRRTILLSLVLLAAAGVVAQSYWLNGVAWPSGTVPIQIELGASPALIDGCADWSCSAAGAISRWNLFMGRVQLKAVERSTQIKGELNGRNDMFFATDMYGKAFGQDTLALTTWWFRDDKLMEADIGFNQAKKWDSYRGTTRPGAVYDLRRVALHELGHVLGLGHPNDHGQTVVAMMNGTIGNLDSLTVDDIAGIQAIYGAPGGGTGEATGGASGATINFPPRNETYDFRGWLESKYSDHARPAGRALRTRTSRGRSCGCRSTCATASTRAATSRPSSACASRSPGAACPACAARRRRRPSSRSRRATRPTGSASSSRSSTGSTWPARR